jgi:hypothetical protein
MRGGQWQALRLHRGLVQRGHESFLLAHEESPLLAAARKAKLPCGELLASRIPLLSHSTDLVHAHDARSHTLAALCAFRPLVVSRRVAFPVGESAISRWKYRRPNLFIAVSRHVALQLRNGGVKHDRIEVIYDGVTAPPEMANGDAIIAPYTLDPQKGMALTREAAKLAGIRIETSTDLAADLPHARALVYLTYSEGLGSGVLLGMAYGVTVIASKVGGIPELISDGQNGILVENKPRAVASALHCIDPALGRAARATVLDRFTEEHMVKSTITAYRKVLSNV